MDDFGYEYPLFSFQLLPASAKSEDDARFVIFVPQGRLVVPADLRRRGAQVPIETCEGAVNRVLAWHGSNEAAFSAYFLTPQWARSLRFWCDRLGARARARTVAETERTLSIQERDGHAGRAAALWRRLTLITDLAGTGELLPRRPPRAVLAFADALQRGAARALAPAMAARLAPFSFDAALQKELTVLPPALVAARERAIAQEAERRRASDETMVIRGALLGDLARFCKVAAHVLQPEQAQDLAMQRLLPRRQRRKKG